MIKSVTVKNDTINNKKRNNNGHDENGMPMTNTKEKIHIEKFNLQIRVLHD